MIVHWSSARETKNVQCWSINVREVQECAGATDILM